MFIFIYARVSTKGQNVKAQVTRLVEYVLTKHPELSRKDMRIYKEKKSGKSVKGRNAWQNMIKDLKEVPSGEAVIVLEDVSRIARNTMDALIFRRFCIDRGFKVDCMLQDVKWVEPADELSFTVMSAAATYQRRVSYQKSMIMIRKAKAEGKYRGRKKGSKNKPKRGRPKK